MGNTGITLRLDDSQGWREGGGGGGGGGRMIGAEWAGG